MLPELLEGGYGEKFSLGLITSSPAVAVIIPPSIGMIGIWNCYRISWRFVYRKYWTWNCMGISCYRILLLYCKEG